MIARSAQASPETPSETDLAALVGSLDRATKVELLTGADTWSLRPIPEIGLRRLVFSDGPAGVRGVRWDERCTSLNVPAPVGLAATWDVSLVGEIGRLLATEARRKEVDVLLAPAVNIHRSSFAGRNFEVFSEDPILTSEIAVAYATGVQSGGVGVTAKHFVANDSETARRTVDVHIDEQTLHEVYLAPFEALVLRAGVWAVMAAYNGVNGVPMTESPLLRATLREDWGFDGLILSDWGATRTVDAVHSALDVAMPGPGGAWGAHLTEAVARGDVSTAVVDAHVLNVLRLAARVGAFGPTPPPAPAGADERPLLRRAAAAGMVLVRNTRGVLPLNRQLRTLAVIGPNAAQPRTLGGGSATVFPEDTTTPLDGLREALGAQVEISYEPGVVIAVRHAVADPATVQDPVTGQLGVRLVVRDCDGRVLVEEHRGVARLTWFGDIAPGVATSDVAEIEVSTVMTAGVTGTYHLGCSAVGAVDLSIDGELVARDALQLPPGADPFDRIGAPPQLALERHLFEGQRVALNVRHRIDTWTSKTVELNVDQPIADADVLLERAEQAARAADAAVVVVGTSAEVESEGYDRRNLRLPGRQDELLRRVCAANSRTVVVVNSGAPVLLDAAGESGAVLLTWFPGQEFGGALADVLFGECEPTGRTPVTWPSSSMQPLEVTPTDGVLRYDERLAVGYRRAIADGRVPTVPFGHGLGYTTWEYLRASAEDDGSEVRATVTIRNAGTRTGTETVQVYVSREQTAVRRPPLWLAGFAKASAEPGETRDVEIALPRRVFEHWDTARATWRLEQGEFTLHVGRSSADLPLRRPISFGPGGA